MSTPPSQRSVKIASDERGGWSSDRPRREGEVARPVDISTRCRVLRPSDRMRYSPGSLVILVSASASERDRFLERVLETQGPVLGIDKVRGLIAGRVPEEDLDTRAAELLDAAISKRLEGGDSVVLAANGFDASERERYLRMANGLRRPRHLVLLEIARDQVPEEDLSDLNALRRALDTGEAGQEGFQTALRLGGNTADEVKRIVFRPPPKDD